MRSTGSARELQKSTLMPEAVTLIAVDGPAASGKGTIAKRLARHFGYAHLDTGLIYRAVAKRMIEAGDDPADPALAECAARAVGPEDLRAEGLRAEDITAVASVVAAHPGVRKALVDFQRAFAGATTDGMPGAVLDGRDIGSVICPDADYKIFIDARLEVRAERRQRELQDRGLESIYSRVLRDMEARDARDRNRSTAPLMPAEDAFVLDTSEMDADEAFDTVLAFIVSQTTPKK